MEEDIEKKEDLQEEKPLKSEEVSPTEGEKDAQKNIRSKRNVRLLVTGIVSAISFVFFGLSYFYFTFSIAAIVFTLLVALVAFGIVAMFKGWETPYKLTLTTLYIAAVFLIGYFALQKSGVFAKIHTAEDFVEYINNSGGIAEVLFVIVNFLQVTIIPIPSTITTTAGAMLFTGIWKPLYLTLIGVLIGSMFAFFLGRVFGVRFANWLVGEKTIEKYKKMTKGKDKIVLFYMFLFPFFPDDFLCILAGMTNYTYLGFFIMQVFCRTIGILTTILLTKGIVSIPLQGWWLLLWGFLIIFVIVLLVFTIKFSDKIEAFIMKLIDKLTFGRFAKWHSKKKQAEEEKAASAFEEASVQEKGEDNDYIEHKSDSV